MRRFGRWMFNVLAAVALLICIALVILWVRSYPRLDEIDLMSGLVGWDLASERGYIRVERNTYQALDLPPFEDFVTESKTPVKPWKFETLMDDGYVFFDFRAHDDEVLARRMKSGRGYFIHGCGFTIATFRAYQPLQTTPATRVAVVIPMWFAVLVFGVLPVFAVRRFRNNRACPAPGRCASCGYDLRATPDRCPECGTVQAKAKISD
jgi:hypothetical protein